MNIFKSLFKRKPKYALEAETIQAPEKMPVREIQMTELMGRAITVAEKTFVPLHICIYEDSLVFEFDVYEKDATDKSGATKQSFTFPTTENRLVPIEFDGVEFFWDLQDDAFRWPPRKAPETAHEVNAWISAFDNGDLRIEKAFAEHNLSKKALAYAYKSDDAYYYWNMDDCTHFPVLYEIPGVFKSHFGKNTLLDPDIITVINQIAFYANSYSLDEPADFKDILTLYNERRKKTPWTPDAKEE